MLAFVLPHFDALTHLVIRVSSAFIFQTFAEVCYFVFVNRSSFKSVLNFRKTYIFKSLLKVFYRSVFNESSKKAFIVHRIIQSPDVMQLTLTLKMTTAQVVETSITVNNNSPIQDYVHPDDQTQPSFEMTPGFKPFTLLQHCSSLFLLF